jgi:hypothetical protein
MKVAALAGAFLAGIAHAQDYSTGLGTWRGPLQFNMTVAAERDPEAHAIAPAVIEIASDGMVRGVSTDAGCRFSGLARQMNMPTVWTMDVTTKNCKDARFNQRYAGTLSVYKNTREGHLTLTFHQTPFLGRKQVMAQLSAVLKR